MHSPLFLTPPHLPTTTTTSSSSSSSSSSSNIISHLRTSPFCHHQPSTSFPPPPTRRHFIQLSVLTLLTPLLPAYAQPSPTITDRAYFDISIAGKPHGRLIVGLYDTLAPTSVQTFKSLATGTLHDKRGRTAGYRYSQAAKIVPAAHVELGKVKQNDPLNQQPGTPQRQQLAVIAPLNSDYNSLVHDRKGLVSMKKGGGAFEFQLALGEDRAADDDWVVIGEVVEGMQLVDHLGNVPTNRKTIRDGYRNVGKVIGDSRANLDLEDKPLQKIQITNCGLFK